jgi:homotetrameric cytidine deaminase
MKKIRKKPAAFVDATACADLVAVAHDAAAQAYAKHSKHRVGAALLTERGNVFTGVNVENDSYGLTMCAERNAIGAAIAAEGPAMRLAALACVVRGPKLFSPCGACRQVMAQFGGPETTILYARNRGPVTRTTLGELLPQAFGL